MIPYTVRKTRRPLTGSELGEDQKSSFYSNFKSSSGIPIF